MCQPGTVLECVINVSEGRHRRAIERIAQAGGASLLDVHSDEHHHRSVFTLAGAEVEGAARSVTVAALAQVDLSSHTGAHPRLGAVDVVPFVPLAGSLMADAIAARDNFATWAGAELGLSCFIYGPERTLPDVRRRAFSSLAPDTGPNRPDPRRGGCAVGARSVLVAYNVWLGGRGALIAARRIAGEMRSASVRTLGLDVGGRAQVSFNLIDPERVGPQAVFDTVALKAQSSGQSVTGAELVGLVPRAVLADIPQIRWKELDLGLERTIEARLDALGGPESAAPGKDDP